MSPEAGRAWFRIATTITLVSAVLVFFTEPDTAERVLSEITLFIGLLFIVAIIVLIRFNRNKGGD
jgi:NADH:ubiquinone oxidoreductase subunit 4 (subunit M)